MRMVDDAEIELRPYADGPAVRAVDTKLVRAEFFREHPVDIENTHEQQQDARRKAFDRAIKSAQGDTQTAQRCAQSTPSSSGLRRHQPRRPPLTRIRPGSPAPAMGPGTVTDPS
jgi:hypothetical protein